MGRALRRAGGRWRLLVHEWLGRRPGSREGVYGVAHHIQSDPPTRPTGKLERVQALPGTEFDELVVGDWLHVEQMDTGFWWMNVGGVVLHVWADRDGKPTSVSVHGPGDWNLPEDGCDYSLVWESGGNRKQ